MNGEVDAQPASPAMHVGVDVGGTSTRVVTFDRDLAVTGGTAAPTPRGATAICKLIAELVVDSVDGDKPATVAVGMPGRIDSAAGIVSAAVNLGISEPVAIADRLGQRIGHHVHLENDVNAAALGAFSRLGLPAQASLAYVNIGTGIAAGFVLGGRLLRGATGGAGEIGHIPMRPDGPACACGQLGCAEAIGSGRAVGTDPTRRHDAVAALAWTVQLCVMTLDVDIVAVGGGMTEQGTPLLEELRARLAAGASASAMLADTRLADRVMLAPAGEPLGSLGAVLAAREVAAWRS